MDTDPAKHSDDPPVKIVDPCRGHTLAAMGSAFNAHSGADMTLVEGVTRIRQELLELLVCLNSVEAGEEMADVVLCVASLAAGRGIDLDAHVAAKHRVNMARRWGPHRALPGGVQPLDDSA